MTIETTVPERKRRLQIRIPAQYDGEKVLKVLKEEMRISGTLIKRLKHTQGILLNNVPVRTIDPVRTGELLEVVLSEREGSKHVIPVESCFDIVYEDDDLMVVNKPAGMSVHSSRKSDLHSLANALAYYFQQKGEYHIFRAVNRLDRQTSGLMILAKNEHANALLIRQQKQIKKGYLALTEGIPDPKQGTLSYPIRRAEDSVLKRVVAADGKQAITHYTVLKHSEEIALVQIELETGRTHQIRVHFSHIGCPLLGDWLYGREENSFIRRHALHAWTLSFFHPISGERMHFETALPEDMAKIASHLENVN